MISRAKAASAGSTEAEGPRARRSSLLPLLALACLAACLLPASALASETRLPVEAFGSDGTSATSFGFSNEVGAPIAFDQANKRLYAYAQGPSEVFGYDASTPGTHTPLGGSFPLAVEEGGELPDLAVNSTSHDLYYESTAFASLYGFDSTGSPLGGNFPLSFSEPCGAAVDPSGDIWVSDFPTQTVTEFDPSGNEIEAIDVSAQSGPFGPCHIALDSESNLYVSFYEGTTWKYTAASGYASASEVDSTVGSYPAVSSPLAVDRSSDDLYVVHSNHVSVYDKAGNKIYEFGSTVSGAAFAGIAIDESSEQLYLSDIANQQVQVFGPPLPLAEVRTEEAQAVTDHAATLTGTVNPNGKALTACVFEYGTTSSYGETAPCVPAAASIPADTQDHAVSASIAGLNPNTPYHYRLVATTAEGTSNGADRALTTAIGAPTVSAQSLVAAGTTEATVSAKIDPKGAKTTYRLEYGPTASYGQSTPLSAPIGAAGDDSQHTVNVRIEGLDPSTGYHFRFVATSNVGTVNGTDATFATYGGSQAFGPCPNDALRPGVGAKLPDCRAYEQASPVNKNGGGVIWGSRSSAGSLIVQAAPDGSRVTFGDNSNLPSTGGSSNPPLFVASRAPGGWSTDGLLPKAAPGNEAKLWGWSDDLGTSLATINKGSEAGLYLREIVSGSQQRVIAGELFQTTQRPQLADFAAGNQHFIFESELPLVPGAVAGKQNLYDLDHGALTLAGRVPIFPATSCDDAGGPACVAPAGGSFAGSYQWQTGNLSRGGVTFGQLTLNTISNDGSKTFFTEGNTGRLYMREDGTRTVQVSASQSAAPDPKGEKAAAFVTATPSGSKVFFMSCQKLTDDATAVSTGPEKTCSDTAKQGQDLYVYDTATGELVDRSVDTNADPFGAQVVGALGTSANGEDVYFVANGVLAPGAASGNCTINTEPKGACNLYLSEEKEGHTRTVTFIARLNTQIEHATTQQFDQSNWMLLWNGSFPSRSRVSAGGTVLFTSTQKLSSYDNKGIAEYYRYAPGDSGPTCVTCIPTGAAPTGDATLESPSPPTVASIFQPFGFLTRNISADGKRVFFQTRDKLLAADTDGDAICPVVGIGAGNKVFACTDVYEWEAPGKGTCTAASPSFSAQDNGCLYLLSSGTSSDPSFFGDADEEGNNAFFFTSQSMVPQDQDQLYDAYDARVEGGLPSQQSAGSPSCVGEGCRGATSSAQNQPNADSSAFAGPGNQKAKRQHKKAKKKQHKAKKHAKKKKKSAAKRAGRNRGGAK